MRVGALCTMVCVAQCLLAGLCPAHTDGGKKKLIASGWDMPTAQQLRRGLGEIERGPLLIRARRVPTDGVVVEAKAFGAPDDVNSCPLREAFSRAPWKPVWFAGTVADLKAARSTRLTDDFLGGVAAAGAGGSSPEGSCVYGDPAWHCRSGFRS
jgi:hypothetical protein